MARRWGAALTAPLKCLQRAIFLWLVFGGRQDEQLKCYMTNVDSNARTFFILLSCLQNPFFNNHLDRPKPGMCIYFLEIAELEQ